jgi:hypothetical protein
MNALHARRTRPGPLALVSRAAPVVAAALLAWIAWGGRINAGEVPGAEEYRASVRAAVEALPWRLGSWVGADIETPPAAIQLLKPNVLKQRRYVNDTTGRVFNVLLVHCSDTRDMRGHYPPVCYPAHGWKLVEARTTTMTMGGQSYPARSYLFSRVVQGVEQRMLNFSFFVLPDGTLVADDAALDRSSGARWATQLGAAQVQIVGGEDLPEPERMAIVQEFIAALEGAIRTVAQGVRPHG